MIMAIVWLLLFHSGVNVAQIQDGSSLVMVCAGLEDACLIYFLLKDRK